MTHSEEKSHVLTDLVEPLNQYLHVPIAARLVTLLKHTPVTPDQVTYASILFGLASAYCFSRGTATATLLAGILLEITLLLDCADGQLARAKGCSSEWGRILDGIAGYISYLSVVIGMMVGLGGFYGSLGAITVLTILKAISYDYCKQTMTSVIQEGHDASKKDILDAYRKHRETGSTLSAVYFYYLQMQQFIFQGRWVSIKRFDADAAAAEASQPLPPEKRTAYWRNVKPLMALWKWNGPDLVLFIFILLAVSGLLQQTLPMLALLMALQMIGTLIAHRRVIRREIAP